MHNSLPLGGVVSVIHKDESWGDNKAPEREGLGGRGVVASLAHLSDMVTFLELLGRRVDLGKHQRVNDARALD